MQEVCQWQSTRELWRIWDLCFRFCPTCYGPTCPGAWCFSEWAHLPSSCAGWRQPRHKFAWTSLVRVMVQVNCCQAGAWPTQTQSHSGQSYVLVHTSMYWYILNTLSCWGVFPLANPSWGPDCWCHGRSLGRAWAWQIQVDVWTAGVLTGVRGAVGQAPDVLYQKVQQVQSAMSSVYIQTIIIMNVSYTESYQDFQESYWAIHLCYRTRKFELECSISAPVRSSVHRNGTYPSLKTFFVVLIIGVSRA